MQQLIRIGLYGAIAILAIIAIYSAYTGYTVSNSQERKIDQLNFSIHENQEAWQHITIGEYSAGGLYKEL